jgi:hypothetical protein
MSFTLMPIVGTTPAVTLDVAPVIRRRAAEGSPARVFDVSITKSVIATEYPLAQDKTRLRLGIAQMTDAQRIALEASLKTPGPRVVNTGVESPNCVPGDYSEQLIEELILEAGYPDVDQGGTSPLPDGLKLWRAELVFYRLS